ncbi:MAG: peptidoglycan editing factor PgeF [Polaromonas sp.]
MTPLLNADWLVPDWPAPAGVQAVFTTRAGGTSRAPWDSMNLGDHVGDLPAQVAANRTRLSAAVGAHTVFLQQVHGSDVRVLDSHTPDGLVADACVTQDAGVACTIMVADCLPVLLATACGTVVGAAHAGWRGLAGAPSEPSGGVLEAVHASLAALAKADIACSATDLIAWLGPCIGPDAFEVGAEVKAAFEAVNPGWACCFRATGPGKFMADLPALARLRLQALGVVAVYGNDGSAAWCTASNPSRFFSHRRDAGPVSRGGNGFFTTGRMAACIWKG